MGSAFWLSCNILNAAGADPQWHTPRTEVREKDSASKWAPSCRQCATGQHSAKVKGRLTSQQDDHSLLASQVLKRPHLLLVTLLLVNAAAMEASILRIQVAAVMTHLAMLKTRDCGYAGIADLPERSRGPSVVHCAICDSRFIHW